MQSASCRFNRYGLPVMGRAALFSEFARLIRFSLVGVLATVVHLICLFVGVTVFLLAEQTGNLIAFLCALGVSFVGHYHFTFRSQAAYRRVLPRFFLVTICGYFLSAAVIAFLGQFPSVPASVRLTLAVLSVPAFSYVAHRYLVFHHEH